MNTAVSSSIKPDDAAKKRHPFVFGLISGFVGSIAVVAAIYQINDSIGNQSHEAGGGAKTVQEATDVPQPPRDLVAPAHANLGELLESLASQTTSRLQKGDGSIRVTVDAPTWPSQAWTTAQVLVGVLSGPADAVLRRKESILDAARYVASTRNPNGGGWQKYYGKGPSIIEPTAWAAIMFARLYSYPGLLRDDEKAWARSQARLAATDVVGFWEEESGAFRTVFQSNDKHFYAYSSVMGLWATLSTMDLAALDREVMDRLVARSVGWLSDQQVEYLGRCRFRSESGARLANEPFGLALQALYVLALARSAGFDPAVNDCEVAMIRQLGGAAEFDPLSEESFQAVHLDSDYAKQVRTLWYPWALLWADEIERSRPSWSAKVAVLRARLLEARQVHRLTETFSHDDTWRIGECMIAWGTTLRIVRQQQAPTMV